MRHAAPVILNSQFPIHNSQFSDQVACLRSQFDSLANRKLVLFGGKGGVGKTTLSSLAALHLSEQHEVTLFSTDPASNLRDLFGEDAPPRLRIEAIDASALYQTFLDENLEAFLELGDRGTYLDRDELRRFFELSIPGADELMAWLRIGDLADERDDLLIVDTAPTGHTLRMLGSSAHFAQLEKALESMQAKHTDLVAQLTRRTARDAMDKFLEQFGARFEKSRALFRDVNRTSFVAVFLAEPLVVEQTARLIREVQSLGVSVPFAVLNQAVHDCDCARCATTAEAEARADPGVQVVRAPRACIQLDSTDRLRSYLQGSDERAVKRSASAVPGQALEIPPDAKLVFFAGKGGVGKTSTATSIALQTAESSPQGQFTIISVDPAHSLRDVFAGIIPPSNLSVEIIDTKGKWRRMRESLGEEISRAVDALTPRGVSLVHDEDIVRQLIEIAPPGSDELFAIDRLADLIDDPSQHRVFVDTAPTGHFLRLLELPKTAGEWVREFMRLLLKYRELISPGSLGEQLVRASRALNRFDAVLQSSACATVVVTRPDRIVMAETRRLIEDLENRGMSIAAVVGNALTPETDCSCDQSRRGDELGILDSLGTDVLSVERRSVPPASLQDLRTLVPLAYRL